MGDQWKDMILDFTGFDALVEGLPQGTVRLLVNTLLKTVRLDRHVTVILDPKEGWGWPDILLGTSGRSTHRVDGEMVPLPGGLRQVDLVSRRRRRGRVPEHPEGTDLVLLGTGRPNRATLQCQVTYLDEHRRKRRIRFTATSPAQPTAALQSLLVLAGCFPGKVIAVSRKGAFATAMEERPANAHRALVVAEIQTRLTIDEGPGYLLVHRPTSARRLVDVEPSDKPSMSSQ